MATEIENIQRSSERGVVISKESAISHILKLALTRQKVVLEGSPVYLFPNSEYASQEWEHKGFTRGWDFINTLDQTLDQEQVQHAVLIDDFNNIPQGYEDANIVDERFSALRSIPVIAESVIFDKEKEENQVIFRFETDFTRDDESFDVCSNLDAGFQREKILFSLSSGTVTPENLDRVLLVVAHPAEFTSQQSMMLTSLLGEMKYEPFNQIPKKQRRELLERMYRHVWFDATGAIVGVTHPVWDGQKFIHEDSV